MTGGATLAQSLSRLGLIDEYNLVMHPIVLGSGKPLFTELSAAAQFEAGEREDLRFGCHRPHLPAGVNAS